MSAAISVFRVEGRFYFVFRLRRYRRKSDLVSRRQPADVAAADEGNRCAAWEIEQTMNGKKSQYNMWDTHPTWDGSHVVPNENVVRNMSSTVFQYSPFVPLNVQTPWRHDHMTLNAPMKIFVRGLAPSTTDVHENFGIFGPPPLDCMHLGTFLFPLIQRNLPYYRYAGKD